jgi:hypothetical protein
MLKFRCQHCGQRIAVPARHLGKLVTCAECGQVTHPLAEQLVRAKQSGAPAPAPAPLAPVPAPPPAAAQCANCGKPLGNLQACATWAAQRVCMPCYHVLSSESSVAGRASPVTVSRVAPAAGPATSLSLRDRVTRALVVLVVAAVALYGAMTLLRDIAGLVATAAVAVLALLALYAVFRSRLGARSKPERGALAAQ